MLVLIYFTVNRLVKCFWGLFGGLLSHPIANHAIGWGTLFRATRRSRSFATLRMTALVLLAELGHVDVQFVGFAVGQEFVPGYFAFGIAGHAAQHAAAGAFYSGGDLVVEFS